MSNILISGEAFGARVNTHRANFDGSICQGAATWDCGTKIDFRINSCSKGFKNCFSHAAFADEKPEFRMLEQTVVDLLIENPKIFNNQWMFLYGAPTRRDDTGQDLSASDVIFGFYMIEEAIIDGPAHRQFVTLRPVPGKSILFPQNAIRRPQVNTIPGIHYLKRFKAGDILTILEDVEKSLFDVNALRRLPTARHDQYQNFVKMAKKWRDTADKTLRAFDAVVLPKGRTTQPPPVHPQQGLDDDETQWAPVIRMDHKKAAAIVEENGRSQQVRVESEAAPEPPFKYRLPEKGALDALEAIYGEALAEEVGLGAANKHLLLFAGESGSGKSRLASMLLDDVKEERSKVIPVSANWRSSESLLGYVNPVTSEFMPTEFTRFLIAADDAWMAGDSRVRVVVFDEINLSQPEHWASDLLARMEYPGADIERRSIYLGGTHVHGMPEQRETKVFIPPSLILVGTLNRDHTVKPLTARVLDRAALIEIPITPAEALRRVGLVLEEAIVSALQELNAIFARRDAGFSIRAASSLAEAVKIVGPDQTSKALDVVLTQELLPKVRLTAGVRQGVTTEFGKNRTLRF